MTHEVASRLVHVPEGRVLDVWEGGRPDGVPIVFHHGTPSGRLQAVLGAQAANRHGVRLVSFNRPGYGRSTDSPPSLASVGLDTLHVTEALGITDFAVLGVSGEARTPSPRVLPTRKGFGLSGSQPELVRGD